MTVLDDLAAVTRMTGGLNVGGNQTFPGPFYVRWATLGYTQLHSATYTAAQFSDEFEHDGAHWRGTGAHSATFCFGEQQKY